MHFFLSLSHPVIESYFQSDLIGKLIFLSLGGLSIICWTLIAYKYRHLLQIRKHAAQLQQNFVSHQEQPLAVPYGFLKENHNYFNPFFDLYILFKECTIQRLKKNHLHLQTEMDNADAVKHVYLSSTDLEYIESALAAKITNATHTLSKDLFLFSLTVTLAPFLGLFGTVWGILMSFANMSMHNGGNSVLAGIAMALGTTVVGLIVAIPALIAYHYFKGVVQTLDIQMECFVTQLIASVDMQYRQVDVLT